MQTLILTVPELERAARQWAADFLHQKRDAVTVVTDVLHARNEPYDDRAIILFQRASAPVLRHVLQGGGSPWLVSQVVNRVGQDTHYSM